jgi:hypothetical protein
MLRELLIKKTVDNLVRLPDQKLKEVSDFAEFLISKLDDSLLVDAIQKAAAESQSFKFLESEEELYSRADLKEVFR